MINSHRASGEEEGIRISRCTGVMDFFLLTSIKAALFLFKPTAKLKETLHCSLTLNFIPRIL